MMKSIYLTPKRELSQQRWVKITTYSWQLIHRHKNLSIIFSPGLPFNRWNDPGFWQQYPLKAQDGSLAKEAIPMPALIGPGRRGAGPFSPPQLSIIFNTSEGMTGWLRRVAAGSIASSPEVNFMTFRIYTDAFE